MLRLSLMYKFKILLIIILLSLLFSPRLWAQEYNLAAETLYSFGQAFFKQQRYVEAKEEFKKCLMLNPQHHQAKGLLELCEKKSLSERDKAIQLALEDAEKIIKPESEVPAQALREEESLAPPIQRGAWTLVKGRLYTEIYTKYYWHNHHFNDKRNKKRWDDDGKYNELRTELKLEYGLTDSYNLLLSMVAKEAHWKDNAKSSTRNGFTEITPGIKYLLFEEPFICSLQGKIKFPLNFSEEATPSLGNHQIDGEVRLLTAQPWPKLPGYTKFESGFKGRNEEPANEIAYFFEFGYNLTPNIILKTTLDGKEALNHTGQTDEDLVKYTIGPIFKIKDLFNLEFGFGHTFLGKNTSAAKEVIISVASYW